MQTVCWFGLAEHLEALIGADFDLNEMFKNGQTPLTDATIKDITISNDYLLTAEQISLTVNEFINTYTSTAVRNTTGEGSVNHDLIIYQWDNFNLHINYTGEQI